MVDSGATGQQWHPKWLGAILIGGAAGTLLRAWLQDLVPVAAGGWPWATFGINLTGSLLLAVLLELLSVSGPDDGWRRILRLGVGTGFLGGYTTYSAFAVETVSLLEANAWLAAIGYALSSVVLGVAASLLGIVLVQRIWWRGSPEESA